LKPEEAIMHLIRSRFARTLALSTALSLAAAACNDTSAPTYALGNVVVVVTDANGAAVDLQQVYLMLTDKATLWRTAVTDTQGKATFGSGEGGVLVQNYLVFFPPQVQYTLAPGETNYKPVTAVENQTVTVELKVA
jgi:hypothetical protein